MVTNSIGSGEITFKIPVTESDLDKKPAARKEPIKDTPILKAPIIGSHLGKRLRLSASGPTDMSPVVTENPDLLTLTETQLSQNSISLGKEDLGLLAGEPIPKASLKEGKT